ncbi:MAG: sugar ABC transporter substrate-binding protein [Leptolyngbya sp. SIO3F4]|nr:sugar ABC transporter substrate-binding protein [Leptolyngbya sp. SIO3F4]
MIPVSLKRLSLLIGLLCIANLGLGGCGKRTVTEGSDTLIANSSEVAASADVVKMVGVDDAQPATQPWNIVYVLKVEPIPEKHPYWTAVGESAKVAAKDFGVNVRIKWPENAGLDGSAIENQISLIAQLIEDDTIDGMVVGPLDSVKIVPIVEQAIAKGIPVISFGTAITSNQLLTSVSINNKKGGEAIGKWVVEKLEGKGKVLILDGPAAQQNALDRRNAILGGLGTGDIELLDIQSADWSSELAKPIVEEWVQTHSDIDAIVAANDPMAIGAAEKLTELGYSDVVVTGFSGSPSALNAIQSNLLAATVDQAPSPQSRRAMQLLIQHLETGRTFDAHLPWQSIDIISSENIDDYLQN